MQPISPSSDLIPINTNLLYHQHPTEKDFENLAVRKGKNVQDLTVAELREARLVMDPQQWLVVCFKIGLPLIPKHFIFLYLHVFIIDIINRESSF